MQAVIVKMVKKFVSLARFFLENQKLAGK